MCVWAGGRGPGAGPFVGGRNVFHGSHDRDASLYLSISMYLKLRKEEEQHYTL